MSAQSRSAQPQEPFTLALAQGEAPERVFDRFVRSEGAYVLGVVHRLLGDAEEARDVTQDAFLKAFSAVSTFRGECTLRTWVTRIALHLAQRRLGRRRLRNAIFALFSSAARTPAHTRVDRAPDTALDLSAQAEVLARVLAAMPPKQATVLSLRFQDGHTVPEIAELLGVETATIKTHLTRALDRIRAQWPPPTAGGPSQNDSTRVHVRKPSPGPTSSERRIQLGDVLQLLISCLRPAGAVRNSK